MRMQNLPINFKSFRQLRDYSILRVQKLGMKSNCTRALLASLGFVSATYLHAHYSPAISKITNPAISAKMRSAKIMDIVVEANGYDLRVLVKLSEQPDVAASQLTDKGFTLSINGLSLNHQSIDPQHQEYVSAVIVKHASASDSSLIDFETASIKNVKTEIFQNSILITALLQSPAPRKHSKPDPSPSSHTNSSTLPTAAEETILSPTDASCALAETKIAKDPWDIDALADQTLCLIKNGKTQQALEVIEQISSFDPNNWKATFAKAEIFRENGDASQASIYFSYARQYADTDQTKQAIQNWQKSHE